MLACPVSEHYQPVDADAQAAGGRHSVFQGGQEVFVQPVYFFVLVRLADVFLGLKPGSRCTSESFSSV